MKGLEKYYKIMLTTIFPESYISDDYIEYGYYKYYFNDYETLEYIIKAIDNSREE